jgi:hypothetical protein
MGLRSHLLVALSVVVPPASLSSCVTYETSANYDVGFNERFEKATRDIVARSREAESAALKGQRASLDPKVAEFMQRHFVKADEIVVAHLAKLKPSLSRSFNAYAERREALLDFTLKLDPSLDFVESNVPNATAFPSGKIIINRPLAEAFDVNRQGLDPVLLGVLVHELLHVRDGHALEQWASADGRQAWAADRAIGVVSSLTELLPWTFRYNIQYQISFGAAKQLPALSEYAADMGAVLLLERAGYESAPYIVFLSELSAASASRPSKTGTALLRQRTECLGTFSKSRFEGDLQGILIGSREAGDRIVQGFDLRPSYKISLLLDSPEELAKQYPLKPQMSDADRRSALLAHTRKVIFTGCAIRNSFADIELKEGILITPTFDIAMFDQF